MLAWARERSGLTFDALTQRFPKLLEWESGDTSPTLRQLEDFARATHIPVGFLLLPAPIAEALPIPDFRTMADAAVDTPSPDLLDTVLQCERRQEWYRSYAQTNREEAVRFVGSLTLATGIEEAGAAIRKTLTFEIDDRGPTWSAALEHLIEKAEEQGVLVMRNGVVGSNTHRKLDPHEFRGFALADPLAPLIFVNGADSKAAQIFTVAHELAHLWVGETALSDARLDVTPTNAVERWCNQVAAEVLVPLQALRDNFDRTRDLTEELDRLALLFKASTLVVLRRVHDAKYLSFNAFRAAYVAELDRVMALIEEKAGSGGGNFIYTQPVRMSKRFTRSIVASALEGQTLYRDAFQMLGFKKQKTFDQLAQHLGLR
jgi:Zn-dependent peptidase ImmA (M78 family)